MRRGLTNQNTLKIGGKIVVGWEEIPALTARCSVGMVFASQNISLLFLSAALANTIRRAILIA